jgi:small redox-active disulfide protein 2
VKITVYGPGCPKCVKTEEVAREAVRQAGVEAEVVKVTDVLQMANAGVLLTPALAIDGKLVVSGKVPEVAEVVGEIMSAAVGA